MAPHSGFRAQGQGAEAITVDPLFLDFQAALAGRYSLERELGRGGMGVVYLAREVSLDRLVAIKLLPPQLAADPAQRDRFLREARLAAQLSQPNIIPIHAVEQTAGFVFFVMAYVDGETLGERIRRQGPLPAAEATRILREIAWALTYAHAQGVIHRDLKPDNIILERATGRAVLTDFGIARRLESGSLTAVNELVGTPEFMSPEQATGEAIDGRADLYALGIVGFYSITGRLPFEGPTVPALLVQQASVPAPSLAPLAPGAPRSLCTAIMRCLEKDPEDRYPDARDFADALSLALEARREVPAPVRAFVKDSLEIRAGGCLYLVAAVNLGPAIVFSLLARMGALRNAATALPLFLLYIGVVLIGIPAMAHIARIRRLARAGYGVEDVLAGARADLDQKKEEIAFTVGREPSRLETGLWKARWLGLVVSAGAVLLLALGIARVVTSPAMPVLVGGLGLWVLGLLAGQRRRDLLGERRVKYWSSRFGRWLFKVATAGLPARSAVGGATHRPTEMALAFAAEDLYAELPRETRAALPGLPDVLRRLEQQARAVRARIEQLDQSLLDARRHSAVEAVTGHRDALLGDLTAARELARTRLSEAVAALETIRLDLLRLRAGAGSVDRITADLAAVGDIGAAVDRLLAAGREIDEDLKS